MTGQAQASEIPSGPAPQSALPVRAPLIAQMRVFAIALAAFSLTCLVFAVWAQHQHSVRLSAQLGLLDQATTRLNQELGVLNTAGGQIVQPTALQSIRQLGQQIRQQGKPLLDSGLGFQTTQQLLGQAIETLSRPVGASDLDDASRRQLEIRLRLDALPFLTQLKTHLLTSASHAAWLAYALALILGAAAAASFFQWRSWRGTQALKQRVVLLSRALHTQQESELKRQGAHSALEGVLKALAHSNQLEHRGTLIELGKQLEALNHSGRSVLQFAKNFHQLSGQSTQLAKTALNSEQRNQKAQGHMGVLQGQFDGLRGDVRAAAQGLRKAGEVSRQLLSRLDGSQLELNWSEPENQAELQNLVEQSQIALKEAIEGLVLASQKLNMSQMEANRLAEFMAVNETTWANLLSQVEHTAEAAAADSEKALRLAKQLIDSRQTLIQQQNGRGHTPPALPPQA